MTTALAGALSKEIADDRRRALEALGRLSFDGWDVLLDPTEAALAEVAAAGAKAALVSLQLDAATFEDEVDADVAEFAAARSAELVGMRRTPDGDVEPNPDPRFAITEGTRELIRADVTTAFTEGLTRAELADLLAENYAFSEARATTIADTEISRALIAGNVIGWKRSGIVDGKEWILGSEHDVDDECDENVDDGVIGIDEAFSSGDDAPPAHPRCVCDVVPVLASPSEDGE